MGLALHPLLASAADAGDRAGRTDVPVWADAERDRAWLARIRAGDAAALDQLARAYVGKLARYAETIIGTPDLADEAVQDVVIALWDQRETVEITGAIGGYLYRAVRNRALNVVRRERSQHRIAMDSVDWTREAHENAGPAALDVVDLRAQVDAILAGLPRRCRETFLLVWGDGLGYLEVAEVLGVSVRTVQNQYYRAVAVLAKHFGDGGREGQTG